MGISKGTKLTDNPKNNTFKIRMDEQTTEKLEAVAKAKNISKAEVIRKGIEIQFNSMK